MKRARCISILLWGLSVGSGLLLLAAIVYVIQNKSGHTGWEPLTALGLFLPAFLLGAFFLPRRGRFGLSPTICSAAMILGLTGTITILALDRTNALVEYHRWIGRGMPGR